MHNGFLENVQAFYKYASPDDLTRELNLSPKLSTLLYNYWKLKRKVRVYTLMSV